MKKDKKKAYERPVTQVYVLKCESHLLTLSNPGDYFDGGDPWSDII